MALRGALIEYSGPFLGPLPNLVVFQFNPEQIARTIRVADSPPGRGGDRGARAHSEHSTASAPPSETFTVTIALSAAEELGTPGLFSEVTRTFGVGPQIAALEKMAYPAAPGLVGLALDAIGDALAGAGATPAEQPIPRETLPRLLFIWGPTRVLPVSIESMRVTEKEFDSALSPTLAEVELSLKVASAPASNDLLALGALLYTRTVKEAQVVAQRVRGATALPTIVPF